MLRSVDLEASMSEARSLDPGHGGFEGRESWLRGPDIEPWVAPMEAMGPTPCTLDARGPSLSGRGSDASMADE